MAKKVRLTVEMIPKSCQWSNVRTMIKAGQWDILRRLSYEGAKYKCQICGEKGKDQGFKHDLECHEIWSYDDTNKVQSLVGLVSLCPICHLTKHIGRASAMGRQGMCFQKMEEVNGWNHKQVVEHMALSFDLHKERSKHEWSLDISILNEEPYGLSINLDKKRVFKKKRYKKRKYYKRKK